MYTKYIVIIFLTVLAILSLTVFAKVQAQQETEQTRQEITVFWPSAHELEHEVFSKVNETRRQFGLQDTVWNSALWTVTRGHSTDMGENEYFDHTSLEGKSPLDRAWATWEQTGCREAIGENLALIWTEKVIEHRVEDAETNTVYIINILDPSTLIETAIDLWLNSDQGHRENMLSTSWTTTGVGIAVGKGVEDRYPVLITQNFCV